MIINWKQFFSGGSSKKRECKTHYYLDLPLISCISPGAKEESRRINYQKILYQLYPLTKKWEIVGDIKVHDMSITSKFIRKKSGSSFRFILTFRLSDDPNSKGIPQDIREEIVRSVESLKLPFTLIGSPRRPLKPNESNSVVFQFFI